MTLIVFVMTCLLFNSGCKKDSNPNVCDCENKNIAVDNQLYNKWTLESFEIISGKRENIPSRLKEMYIIFSDSVNAQVKGQNNTCGSEYKLFENHCISFTQLSCTEIGGTKEQMEWENKYFNALNNLQCYEISDLSLKIYYRDNDKQKTMNFKK